MSAKPAVGLFLILLGATSLNAQAHWDTPQKDACTAIGLRQWSARLWDIPLGTSWDAACKSTPDTVGGQSFSAPTRCKDEGVFGEWGQFDVTDSSCPRWGAFQDDGCIALGRHQFSAVLHDIPAGMSWEATCDAAPATVSGQSFPKPTRCINKGLFGMWGEFDVSGCRAHDTVIVDQGVDEVGILVDGTAEFNVPVNDLTFSEKTTGHNVIDVGPLSHGVSPYEVIAFSRSRAPTYMVTPWSASSFGDVFRINMDPSIPVSLTMWILSGTFSQRVVDVTQAIAQCGGIWSNERVGLHFGNINFRDATGNSTTSKYVDFISKSTGLNAMKQDIGFEAGRLNVYWADTVDGSTGKGVTFDGQPITIMGKSSSGGLLAHELGHAFVLEHVPPIGDPAYDVNNVMVSASGSRQFLTEGQIFRMHFHPSSAVNYLFQARPGKVTRVCPANTTSPTCVANYKRIWSDGTLAPN